MSQSQEIQKFQQNDVQEYEHQYINLKRALEQSQAVLHLFVYDSCSADVYIFRTPNGWLTKIKRFHKILKVSNISLKELKYSKANSICNKGIRTKK